MPERRKVLRVAGTGLLMCVSAATLAWGVGLLDGPAGATQRQIRSWFLPPPRRLDVIYVPTPQAVVEQMLEMAEVKPGDVVYDLGCGDGRVLVTAAKKYGVKAVGIEIDPKRIEEARENVRRNGVSNLVTIREGSLFDADLSGATVITMYLLPQLNVRLKPELAKLKPGTRIVSHAFDMKGAKPKRVEDVRETSIGAAKQVYLWVVPWDEE
jgi:SAM-dependent methyltransferase